MSNTTLVNVQGKGPVTKTKYGKFEVSLWHWKKTIEQPKETRDLFPERVFDVHRACIKHSQWNRRTQEWEESFIWCGIDDLRSLVQALDGLNYEE